MRNFKKLTATLMAATIVFGLTGCASSSKLGSSKLKEAAKKFGAEEYKDADDFEDDIEGFFAGDDLYDGVYISGSGKDLKSALKDEIGPLYYDKNIKDATVFILNEGDYNFFYILNYSFNSEDEAEDFYDEFEYVFDEYERLSGDVDDGEKDGVTYSVANTIGFDDTFFGVYQSGNSVMIVSGCGDFDDELEDLIGDYDLVLPADA